VKRERKNSRNEERDKEEETIKRENEGCGERE
jgi:hypothetical protein